MARNGVSVWRGGFLALLLATVAGGSALGQTYVNIPVPNGSFDQGSTGNCPNNWVCQDGQPTTNGGVHWPANFLTGVASPVALWRADSEIMDFSFLTLENKQFATMTIPFCWANRTTSVGSYTHMRVYTYNGVGNLVSSYARVIPTGDTTKLVHCNDGFAPSLVISPIPAEAERIRVRFEGYSDYRGAASVGPINITIPSGPIGVGVDGGSSGGGGGGGTLEYFMNVESGGINAAAANIQNYIGQACSNLSSISSAAGLIPDVWGGAGFGGQVAQILQGMRDLCEQELQSEIFGEILVGITTPGTVPGIAGPVAVNPLAAPTSTLGEFSTAIAVHEGNADDLVTAQNRANEIQIASAKYQIAEMQKMRGASQTVYGYQSPRGPRVTAADITANEPNLEFAEGDYGQAYERLNELVDEAELAPNMFRRSQDDGSSLQAAAGVCLLDPEPPTGEGWAYQADRAKWNIRQSLMSTEMGALLCRIAEPEITAGPLCLADTLAPLASVGMISSFMPAQICVEGPSAPDPIPLLFAMLGVLILLGGVMQAIGEFV